MFTNKMGFVHSVTIILIHQKFDFCRCSCCFWLVGELFIDVFLWLRCHTRFKHFEKHCEEDFYTAVNVNLTVQI